MCKRIREIGHLIAYTDKFSRCLNAGIWRLFAADETDKTVINILFFSVKWSKGNTKLFERWLKFVLQVKRDQMNKRSHIVLRDIQNRDQTTDLNQQVFFFLPWNSQKNKLKEIKKCVYSYRAFLGHTPQEIIFPLIVWSLLLSIQASSIDFNRAIFFPWRYEK